MRKKTGILWQKKIKMKNIGLLYYIREDISENEENVPSALF